MLANRLRRIGFVVSAICAMLGVFLRGSGYFWHAWEPLIFDKAGNFRTDGIFNTLSPLLNDMRSYPGSLQGCILLLLLLGAGAAGMAYTYPFRTYPDAAKLPHRFANASLAVVLLMNVMVVVESVWLFSIPAGEHVRALNWAMLMFLIGIIGFMLTIPLSLAAIFRDRVPILGGTAMLLGLTPIPLSILLLHLAASVRGFVIAE